MKKVLYSPSQTHLYYFRITCFQAVGMQSLENIRLNMAELSENINLIILANMQQNRLTSCQTKQTTSHKDGKERHPASVKFKDGNRYQK